MLKKLEKYILKHNLFKQGEKLLVAVSGGPDSSALLHALVSIAKYTLAAAHFNHLTRGKDSDGDEEFVKELCQAYQIPFYADRADVKAYAKEQGQSFQNAARDLRYSFLYKAAKEFGAEKIVLAHHADDQAETVVINLIRGSGLKGLSGMYPLDGVLARPLLAITKEEIEAYIVKNNLSYRIDASNAEVYYTRNRIRHEIVPQLAKFNPALNATLGKMAEILREEDVYLENEAKRYYLKIAVKLSDELVLDLSQLLELDIALQRRIILEALSSVAETEKDFNFRHVEDILKLCKTGSGLKLYLPHKVRAATTYGRLHLCKTEFITKAKGPILQAHINIPGETYLEGVGSIVAEYQELSTARSDAFSVFIAAENLQLPFFVRSRLPGDVFRPLGGNGRVKLKEYFIDLHIQRELRDAIPVIVDNNREIIWLAGVRAGEACRITTPGKMLKLSFHPSPVIT